LHRSWSGDNLFAARQRYPGCLEHVWQCAQDQEKAPPFPEEVVAARRGKRPGCSDKDIIRRTVGRNGLARKTNHQIGPDALHQVKVGGAAHSSYFCLEVFGKLSRSSSHTPGRTVDKDLVSALNVAAPKEL